MKLHPRHQITTLADIDLQSLLINWAEKHDLTWSEVLRILAGRLSQWSVYPVRMERHPNEPDKKADEA